MTTGDEAPLTRRQLRERAAREARESEAQRNAAPGGAATPGAAASSGGPADGVEPSGAGPAFPVAWEPAGSWADDPARDDPKPDVPAPYDPVDADPPDDPAAGEPPSADPVPPEPSPLAPREALAAQPSRAGRNVPVAIGVGLALGAALLASLYYRKDLFVVLAFAACVGALWELRQALRSRSIDIPLLPLVVGSAGMLVSAYVSGLEALLVAFVLTAGGVFVWRVLDGGGLRALRDAAAGVFAAAYVPFLAGFAVLLLPVPGGEWRVLVFIALVVANDTGGFIAGVLFGSHPLAPSVSPKKSWEGAAGSLVLACAVGVVATFFAFTPETGYADGPVDWWIGLVLGAVTVLAATIGDLGESLIKRDLGMKDMGAVLPGHGGILDRLDSLLVAAPVVAVTMTMLIPPSGTAF